MIRTAAVLLALALAQPALAQTAPNPAPKLAPAKPAPRKPVPPKPDAGVGSADPAAVAQRGPCIGVIPHLGRFVVQKIGMTVFNNERDEVAMESWALDDLVVARVRAVAGTRYAVRRIAYAGTAFDPYDHPPSRLFRNADADLKGVVQTIARGGGCERYVVVVKAQSQYAGTNQMVEGLGIINRGSLLLSRTYLFALTLILVYDGHTFEVLKHGAGSTSEGLTLGALLLTNPVHGPSRELKDLSWPLAPGAVMGLRDSVRSLLAESLDKVLPELLAQ